MKSLILLFATVFSIAGAYVPALFGDNDLFSLWSIIGGLVGGILGIWVGVKAGQRWG